MTTPPRLSEQGADAFELALLRSARDDGASASRERALAALGLGATAAVATAATVAAAAGKLPLAGRWAGAIARWGAGPKGMAILALSLAGSVATVAVLSHQGRPARASATATAPEKIPVVVPAEVPVDNGQTVPAAAAPMPALAVDRAAPVAPPTATTPAGVGRHRHRSKLAAATTDGADDALLDEVTRLDRARQQLTAHDGTGALATTDGYLARYPGGRLATEAQALRVHATLMVAGRAAAAPLAATFVHAYPDSPHAPALRRLGAPPTAPARP